MKPLWTGDVVGVAHVHEIQIREIAAQMDCDPSYVGKLLNGKKTPKRAEEKVRAALAAAIEQKEAQNVAH